MNLLYLCFLFFFTIVNAQTFTTTNGDGDTIIGVVSSDPVLGPSTRTISTIAPTTTGTSTGTTTSEEEAALPTTETFRGPVGEPAPSNVGTPYLPFRFQYTTILPNGETSVITQTFTPTNPPNSTVTYATSGTILNYSEYTASFGVPKDIGAAISLRIPSSRCSLAAALSVVLYALL